MTFHFNNGTYGRVDLSADYYTTPSDLKDAIEYAINSVDWTLTQSQTRPTITETSNIISITCK